MSNFRTEHLGGFFGDFWSPYLLLNFRPAKFTKTYAFVINVRGPAIVRSGLERICSGPASGGAPLVRWHRLRMRERGAGVECWVEEGERGWVGGWGRASQQQAAAGQGRGVWVGKYPWRLPRRWVEYK